MVTPQPTRRRFLQTSAATLLAAPFITTGARAASPSGKLRHLAFGASGQSWSDITAFAAHPNWELVAVCDVDTRTFAQVKEKFPNIRTYVDWREALEKEAGQVDSVNISTPDHMHAAIGLAAISRGLHVYGQKPLTQNLAECRAVTLAAREKGIVTQMGIQISSSFGERFTVAMIHRGDIGKIKEVHTFSNKKWGDMAPVPIANAAAPPAELDWDKWVGVSAERPFIPDYYHPGEWRKRREFGTGTLGDMGCHMFSGWYRALALTMPVSVKSLGPPPNATNWANDGKVEYIFPATAYTADSTVKVTWYDGDQRPSQEVLALLGDTPFPDQGSLYIGTEGILLHQHGSTPLLLPKEKFKGVRPPKLEPINHWFDFVDCCLAGDPKKKPGANFDYAGPLTEAVLLGCLASIFPQQTLEWNSEKMLFSNSPEATKFVKRNYRAGWEIPGL